MADWDSLDSGDRDRVLRAIADGAPRRTEVQVLDLDHQVRSALTGLDQGATTASVVPFREARTLTSRIFTGGFVDRDRAVTWDPWSPSPLALWPNRMLQVAQVWDTDTLGEVRHLTFTGPLRRYQRRGEYVDLAARGKEWLAQRELGENRKWAEGTPLIRVIRQLMAATGETFFDLASFPKMVLRDDLVVDAHANVWRVVQRLARSRDLQAWYPGNGRFTVRRLPGNVTTVWKTGEGGLIHGTPTASFDMPDGFHNVFKRTGGRPKGGGPRVRGSWSPNDNHPLSPVEFRRGGVNGRFVQRRRNPKLNTSREADRQAKRVGQDALEMVTDAIWEAIPTPIELGDLGRVDTGEFGTAKVRARAFVIPHGNTATQTMTVNKVRNLSRATLKR